ncbi:MAG TPA: CRISPR-associated endonuclease Cas1 [Candidatus Competibacteraceae bacterium]|nr:CRISPR-associated endonuclease Cas1 [Candidatus Competibacteraceae bacterium]HSA45322.1 CRISPR-associated endonuclease Cas1 [Candidatus Competibacteraceae bacterium]
MGTLYLDRRNLNLRLDGKRLVIEELDARPRGVPLALLERVVMQGQVQFDSGVLAALAEQGTSIVCLSARHSRRTALVLGPGHGDARRRLAQYQLTFDTEARLALARGLIAGKLRAQIRFLEAAQAQRPDVRKPLHDGLATVRGLLPSLAVAADRDAVLGLEGVGAAAYYAALTALFPPSVNFTGRNRRPPRDPVNVCLSLGYTLLHFEAVRAVYGAGLDPLLGFFHEPVYGRESLACDLIEPLRPRLDGWVWALFRERRLQAADFVLDKGACLLAKVGRQVFYAGYETWVPPARRYLRRESYRLANWLNGRVDPLSPLAGGEGAENH